jgi:hypothetical protein
MSVAVDSYGVDDVGEAEQVEVLVGVTQSAVSTQVERVVEVPVDALSVVAPRDAENVGSCVCGLSALLVSVRGAARVR